MAATSTAAPINATQTLPTRIFFIHPSSVKKIGALNWPKDTLPIHRRQLKSISQSRIEHSPRRDGLDSLETLCKSHAPESKKSGNLSADGVPPHPPRVPAWLGSRVGRASGSHRGIAPVSPHDTGPARTPRARRRNP